MTNKFGKGGSDDDWLSFRPTIKKKSDILKDHAADQVSDILAGKKPAASSPNYSQSKPFSSALDEVKDKFADRVNSVLSGLEYTTHSNQTESGSAGSGQGFAQQMEWAKVTKNYLYDLMQHLQQLDQLYVEKISELTRADYMNELLPELTKDALGYSALSGKLIVHVAEIHVGYIGAVLQDLGVSQQEILELFNSR